MSVAPSPLELLAVAQEAAIIAGEILVKKLDDPRVVEHKGQIDLVTDADKASEAALIEFIQAKFPSHEILAEESGSLAKAKSAYRWIMDPLDGTTNYAHGHPQFAVSVGVEGPGGLLAGVVYDPLRRERFCAAKGHGATLNDRPIHVTAQASLERALLTTGFPYDVGQREGLSLPLFNHFIRRSQGVRRCGSAALDLAWTACGRYDGFFEEILNPWDLAAGALIVTEAGGEITRLDGSPFEHTKGSVLTAGPALMSVLIRECRDVKKLHET